MPLKLHTENIISASPQNLTQPERKTYRFHIIDSRATTPKVEIHRSYIASTFLLLWVLKSIVSTSTDWMLDLRVGMPVLAAVLKLQIQGEIDWMCNVLYDQGKILLGSCTI